MRAIRLAVTAAALAAALAVAVPSHAADQSVAVAAFQFVQGGWVAPAPFTDGTAQEAAPAVPSFPRGSRIVWTNLDPLPHRVQCVSVPSGSCFSLRPEMPIATPGATSNLQTTASMPLGKYVYKCSIHLGMRGAFNLTA